MGFGEIGVLPHLIMSLLVLITAYLPVACFYLVKVWSLPSSNRGVKL